MSHLLYIYNSVEK